MKFKQLPQHILAKILIKLYNMKKIDSIGTADIYTGDFNFGVSLGDYILLGKYYINEVTIHHEYGHTLQSHKLGWFYLLLVGIPSAALNIFTRLFPDTKYYEKYPEKQADKLGGVHKNKHGHRVV
jgi:hypothetical protein